MVMPSFFICERSLLRVKDTFRTLNWKEIQREYDDFLYTTVGSSLVP